MANALLEAFKMANALEDLIGEGIARGREEGEVEGKRTWLRTIIRTRFGSMPEALEAHIASADAATLDALLSRALAAERVDLI
ncbi:MAG TPA: hypothetical protein VHB98_09650 [Chloroflexota bacterium]|nr:hypothetical protein [Chloroflexota bacterium]